MTDLTQEVTADDHISGAEDAAITIVEYGDYQCPYCGEAYSVVKKLQEEFGDQLRIVFRNMPIANVHEHAEAAAEITEAAAEQGKFWEVHDLLYENQHDLSDDSLIGYAEKAGCNIDQLQEAIETGRPKERVAADLRSGLTSGVNGTPGFFVNGEFYEHNFNYNTFSRFLKELL